jgi:hypothetical protein
VRTQRAGERARGQSQNQSPAGGREHFAVALYYPVKREKGIAIEAGKIPTPPPPAQRALGLGLGPGALPRCVCGERARGVQGARARGRASAGPMFYGGIRSCGLGIRRGSMSEYHDGTGRFGVRQPVTSPSKMADRKIVASDAEFKMARAHRVGPWGFQRGQLLASPWFPIRMLFGMTGPLLSQYFTSRSLSYAASSIRVLYCACTLSILGKTC